MRVYYMDKTIQQKFPAMDKKMEYLGRGSFGIVYSDGNHAYKVCGFNSYYVKWLLFLKENGLHQNPHVPKVTSIYVDKNKNQCVVKMELLRHGKYYTMATRATKCYYSVQDFIQNKSKKKKLNELDVVLENISHFLTKNMYSCLDLHGNNVMMRGKTLVITDPVV